MVTRIPTIEVPEPPAGGFTVANLRDLDPTTSAYVATGIHRGQLAVPVPRAISVESDRRYP
jgi:hypothetical protein